MALRQVNIDQAIDFLNDLIKLDRNAVHNLITTRVLCNDVLAQHPSVQVMQPNPLDGAYIVGMLGLLNGLFGTLEEGERASWGPLTAVFDEQGCLERFERTMP